MPEPRLPPTGRWAWPNRLERKGPMLTGGCFAVRSATKPMARRSVKPTATARFATEPPAHHSCWIYGNSVVAGGLGFEPRLAESASVYSNDKFYR